MPTPLSFLRWRLYRAYLFAMFFHLQGLTQTILATFRAFEDAYGEYADETLGIVQSILVELQYETPRDRLSQWWLNWMLWQSTHWIIVDEPEHPPYVLFKQISRQLDFFVRHGDDVLRSTYLTAKTLLATIPSSDIWLYKRIQHEALRSDTIPAQETFWWDLMSILYPLPPEQPLSPDDNAILSSLLKDGENSPFLANAEPAPAGGRLVVVK